MASNKGGKFIAQIKTSILIMLLTVLAAVTSAHAQSGGFSISGKVADSGGTGVAGAAISVGSSFVVYTDASGNYTVGSITAGSYVLTASKVGYTFTPITRDVTVSGNVTGQNFTAKADGTFTSCAAAVGIPESECGALVALYDSTNGANWTSWRKVGWKQTDAPCAWYGVSCTGGHVTGLNLNYTELKGSLPSQLGNLINLTSLSMYDNQLSGSIPTQISNLTNLTSISLSNNQLSGSIPVGISNLTNLTELYLGDNQLSGNVPAEFSNLTKLRDLYISNNPLSGSLPLSLMQLTNLWGFSYNQTSLCEPGAITGFQDWLDSYYAVGTGIICGGYTISGKVADSGGAGIPGVAISVGSGFVVYTDASGNYTINPAPNGTYTLYPSKSGYNFAPITLDVTMSGGNASGQNFTAKTVGAFTSCAPIGGISASECDALVALYDSTDGGNWNPDRKAGWKQTDAPCTWTGVSCAGGHVTGLSLNYTGLSGSLTTQLGNLTFLKTLSLYGNNLSGSISPSLGSLITLTSLNLNDNQFSGSIPAQLGNLINLTSLYLNNNQLSGNVPTQLGNLTQLQSLHLSYNPLSGSLPLSLMQLTNLSFSYDHTSLCAPADAAFQDWLNSIYGTGTGVTCGGFTVTGKVMDSGGTGLEGATISLGSGFTVTTDASGNYAVGMLSADTYVLAPSLGGFTFTPITRNITLSGDLSGQDFTAITIGAFTSCASIGGIPESECEALVALYDSTGGDYWSWSGDWKQTDAPCTWSGVTCSSNGHVARLYLSDRQLEGTLPPELGNLPYLTELVLDGNHLNGSIPAELGSLTDLTSLSLRNNQLSGTVPSQLGNLTKLQSLHLSNNLLSGSLPLSLAQITNLGTFSYNQTSLCAPADTAFQNWLTSVYVTGTGITCGGYTITGTVLDLDGAPLANAAISMGSGFTAYTDGSGNYNIDALASGAYLLTPVKAGYSFYPINRNVTVTGNISAQDFTAQPMGIFTAIVIDEKGSLQEGQQFTVSPSDLMVRFSQDLLSDYSEHSVQARLNWMLVKPGINEIYDTTIESPTICSFAHKPEGDDIYVPIWNIQFDQTEYVATLSIDPAFLPLVDGQYRLYICGAASIWDINNIPINGGHNGQINLEVLAANADGNDEIKKNQLPKTGFAPGRIQILAPQPANKLYSQEGSLSLQIPSLGINAEILGVPLAEGTWNTSWLGNSAGYLYGSAYPTWEGNTVLTGHVWNADNTPGIFANIKNLKYGDRFTITNLGQVYTYEVRENRSLSPGNIYAVMKHEELDWVTLLTCEKYIPVIDDYSMRRIVRAVLVEIK